MSNMNFNLLNKDILTISIVASLIFLGYLEIF